jgi:phosphomannomutase/phosphoglucomutase
VAKFFGTNGIRGVFSEDFTLEFVHDMTLAIATYFKKGPILVGYDGRESSPIISKVVCSALNYAGLDCNNAGIVPTPCLEYAVKTLGYSGGIMITASHNPPQYNGIKPAAKDGVEISREDELIIEDIFLKKNWTKNPSKWGITGTENKAIDVYVDGISSQIDTQKIKSRNLKVVLDLGNGAQAMTAPLFCNSLGCETFLINEKIDGAFPGRGSEPTPQNLSELSNTVQKNNAALGIAFDGDGDRSIFCDNNGEILTGDKSALVLTKFILEKNPNSLVVTCLNSGSNIELVANEFNSQVIRTKVGSVEVSRKMVSTNALIGFEENGGFMFGKHNQVRDGCMTLALMLELLAASEKTLSEETSSLPPSFTTKDKVACSHEDSKKLIQSLKEEFPNSDTTDGIKITTDSKNWVMIRPSGTEPIIRIYGEAESQQKLDTLMTKYLQKVKSVISDNTFKTNC